MRRPLQIRRPFLWIKRNRDDSGFTLVEVLVTSILFLIMSGMILITITFLLNESTALSNQAQSAANSQVSLTAANGPLRYAETPYVAALANTAGGPVTAKSPCWGFSSPTFDPAMPAVPALGNTAKAAGLASYGVLGSPADDAILVAHDFDVLFCAPASRTSFTAAPNIYRLWINPTTCTDHTATGGGGCTLQIDNYGPNPFANCAWTSGTSLPSTCPTPPVPLSSGAAARNVWCNLSCQMDIVGTLVDPIKNLTQPALFTYFSSPTSTTPIDTPSDITNVTGGNLPGIHEISVNLATLTSKASSTASTSFGTTSSISKVYLGNTNTNSATILDSAPVVTSVTPSAGPTAGGGIVTITGNYFTSATSVLFAPTSGSTPVQVLSFTVNSASSITATVPANAAGVDDVIVSSINNGSSATSSADSYTYYPTVSSISPTFGPAAGGTSVTITGTGFAAPAVVSFGGGAATLVTVNSATSITAITPSGTAGIVDTTVTERSATSPMSAVDLFTYVSPATITGLSPNFGPIGGGNAITITGTNLSTATGVTFGGTAAIGIIVNSVNSITVTAPAHALGLVNVIVTTSSGSMTATGAYTYSPTVTVVNPAYGNTAVGTPVTITGTGFATSGVTVKFGGVAATYNSSTATSISVTAPAGTPGTVDVIVTVSGVSSQPASADQFTYESTPVVTSVSPTQGPTAGATAVTISGISFAGTTTVKFGSVNATAYVVNSPTTITATAPAGAAGVVDITVTNFVATSATSAGDQFTYVPAPSITSISPTFGPAAGGTSVTITGTNLSNAIQVAFGGNAGTIIANSATSITVTSPAGAGAGAGAGAVSVSLSTPGGTTTAGSQFTYGPSVSGIAPTFGASTGATSVVITGTGFTGTTSVKFGTANAASYTVTSSTSITAVSPASNSASSTTSGTVDVTVQNASTSPISLTVMYATSGVQSRQGGLTLGNPSTLAAR